MRKATALWVGVPTGILLLLVLLLLVVDLFDRQLIANPAARLVEARTGRVLHIAHLDLRWGWPFAIHAENVRLANAEWSSDDAMLRIPALSVSLNPLKLLNGPPYTHVRARDVRALVEQSPQGEWNWELDLEAPETDAGPSLSATVQIDGGRLIYLDNSGEPALEVDLERLSAVQPPGAEDAKSAAVTLRASMGDMPFALDALLAFPPDNWRGSASLQAGDSSLNGDFTLALDTDVPQLHASIESDLLAPAQWAELFPAGKQAGTEEPNLPQLDGFAADLDISVATLRLPTLAIDDLSTHFTVENGQLRLDRLRAQVGGGEIQARVSLDSLAPTPVLHVTAELARTQVSALLEALSLPLDKGEVEGHIQARLRMADRQLPTTLAAALSALAIEPSSKLLYSREDGRLIARPRVKPAGGPPEIALNLEGTGLTSLDASLSAPPLRQLAVEAPYPLDLRVRSDAAQASVRAELGDLLQTSEFSVSFQASGDELPAFPAFGFEPPPVASFSTSGVLEYAPERWALRELKLEYGESELTGSVAYTQRGTRPRIVVDASASMLDFTALPLAGSEQNQPQAEPRGAESWIPETVAQSLRAVDVDLQLSVAQARLTEDLSLGEVKIGAQLQDGALEVAPLAFSLADGKVQGNLTAQAGRELVNGQLALTLDGLRVAQITELVVPLEEHLGRVSGELHLGFAEIPPGETAQDVTVLPTLGRLSLDDTRLQFRDPDSDTALTLSVATPEAEQQRVRIQGEGRFRGEPLRFDIRGDRLLDLRHRERPYNLDATVAYAEADASLEGQIARVWSPQSAVLEISIDGQNPANLTPLLGPIFPPMPPYSATGTLIYERDEERLALKDFSGQFGNSDLHGEMFFSAADQVPALTATLRSARLELEDLGGLIGASTDADESARGDPERLFPSKPFNLEALSQAVAQVDFTATNVVVEAIPISALTVQVQLQGGQLIAKPVEFGIGDGNVQLHLDLDISEAAIAGLIDVEARGVDLDQALANVGIASDSFGLVGGQGRLWVRGDSTASMLASADGGLMLLMTGGALDALLVELAGLDLGGTALAAAGLSERVPINCGYASLFTRGGAVHVDRFIVDSEDSTFFLEGSMNLDNETIDLTLYSNAKDFGLFAANAPIGFGGTLKNPEVDVLSGRLAAHGLEAIALATLAAPVAALLSLINVGNDERATVCEGWVEQLREARR